MPKGPTGQKRPGDVIGTAITKTLATTIRATHQPDTFPSFRYLRPIRR